MTFLPILTRELRARGHSPATYWGRLCTAAFGVAACLPPFLSTGFSVGPTTVGRGAFISLVGAAFLVCCGACLLTADSVSRERRQGTLMLLLLTRVSHWDILLAKGASIGLLSFAGLVAFVPVMMLPLLAGETGAGEAGRVALALVNTLSLALAAGLCVSSFSTDRLRSACGALLLTSVLVLAPAVLGPYIRLASPLGAFLNSGPLGYLTSPARFWISILLVQGVVWGLLAVAVRGLRHQSDLPAAQIRTVAPKPAENEAELPPPASGSLEPVECPYCGRTNAAEAVFCYECGTELHPKPVHVDSGWTVSSAPSPLHWLLARQRGLQRMLWLAAAITACKFALFTFMGRIVPPGLGPAFYLFEWGLGFIAAATAASLIAYTASRFVVEAQHSGELELLLTAPLAAGRLVSTQWDILKRVLRFPLLVMLVPTILQGFLLVAGMNAKATPYSTAYGALILLSAAKTIAGVVALCWLSLWLGFAGMGQGRTIFWTVLLAEGVPHAMGIIWGLFCQLLIFQGPFAPTRGSSLPLLLGSILPQITILLFCLLLIQLARSNLLHRWRVGEPFDVRRTIRDIPECMETLLARARSWPHGQSS